MRFHQAVGLSLVLLPVLAGAQDARLNLPSFQHLQDKAVECVDISIGHWPLQFAARFMDKDSQEDGAAKELLVGLKGVYVRSYTFKDDHSYDTRDIDAVRNQLKGSLWTQVAQVHDAKDDSDLGIYVAMQGDAPNGFAVVATKPREFTIVNVVGKLDLRKLGRLERSVGLTSLAENTDAVDRTVER